MFILDKSQYSFYSVFEDNWQTIRDEFLSVIDDMIPWIEEELNPENGWQVYPIFDWPSGEDVSPFTEKVPFTSNLIKTHVPNYGAAGFSRLKANQLIPPHVGYQGDFLRCHLGLIVPDGDLGLEIEGESFKWQEGKLNVFDDRPRHFAWNHTDEDRVVLLFDFVPEDT